MIAEARLALIEEAQGYPEVRAGENPEGAIRARMHSGLEVLADVEDFLQELSTACWPGGSCTLDPDLEDRLEALRPRVAALVGAS